MIGILGSGFGLYGYLPAVVKSTNEQVVLLSKSFDAFNNRQELQFCKDRIIWVDDENSLLEHIDTLIFSLPPQVQEERIRKFIGKDTIKKIVLEKPICVTPRSSLELLAQLEVHMKELRVAYLFQYTIWGRELIRLISADHSMKKICIRWTFKAHHYKHNLHNWKRYHSTGGSVIRFFGIHLIALISLLGYTKVIRSRSNGFSDDDYYKWIASFKDENLPLLEIMVDSNSETECFDIIIDDNQLKIQGLGVEFKDPFSDLDGNSVDKRVYILSELINSFYEENVTSNLYARYRSTNVLWNSVEILNEYITLSNR